MITFGLPWILVLILLPFLMRSILPKVASKTQSALRIPFFEILEGLRKSTRYKFFGKIETRRFTGFFIWILLVVASAQPRWVGSLIKLQSQGRNLMLVLDLSGSMEEADFSLKDKEVSRWAAVRLVADNFIKKRQGDRIGIVLFGQRAYVYVPLTFDLETASTLLKEAEVGLAGTQTALGDGLALGLKTMIDVPEKSKVIILLSDGIANAGKIRPLQAAELAKEMGVKVYTIGVGSDERSIPSVFGQMVVSREGEIDEKTLQEIATMTGGTYYRAKDFLELYQIYSQINSLEPVKNNDVFIRPVKELFYYPLGVAFVLSVLMAFLNFLKWARK